MLQIFVRIMAYGATLRVTIEMTLVTVLCKFLLAPLQGFHTVCISTQGLKLRFYTLG